MKKILIVGLLLYPLYIGFTQTTKEEPESKREAEIKSQIAANIDTALTNIVNAKPAIKKVIVVKEKAKPKTKEKIITVYVDTCLSDKTQFIYYEKIPETIAVPEVIAEKKLRWYQFKKINKQKKINKSNIK